MWDFTNTRIPLEEISAIVARCSVTCCLYYTKSFCTYIHTYLHVAIKHIIDFLLSLACFLCTAVSFCLSKKKFSEVHLHKVSSLGLHFCMGNGAGNSCSVSVFTLHQDLLINKDVFSTGGQEDSSSPLAVACRGSRSLLHYKGDAVRLLCPLIRLWLCPILTVISAVIANSLISQTISALAMLPWSSYRKIICFSFSACGFHKHQITS